MRSYFRAFARGALLCPLLLLSGLIPAVSAQALYAPWEAVPNDAATGVIPTLAPAALRAAPAPPAFPAPVIVAPNPRESGRSMRRLWIVSAVTLAVATSLDAQSSWGKQEANAVLRGGQGQFGARAVALKAGVNGAWLLAQIIACRKGRAHRAFAIANFAAASLFAVAAVHNYGVSAVPGR